MKIVKVLTISALLAFSLDVAACEEHEAQSAAEKSVVQEKKSTGSVASKKTEKKGDAGTKSE